MRLDTVDALHNTAQNCLYRISLCWHCHQRQERSFFIKGRQMPLCARCTGILVGLVVFPVYAAHVSWPVAAVLMGTFAIHSGTQLLGLRASNNRLRFVTGMGFSVATLALFPREFRKDVNGVQREMQHSQQNVYRGTLIIVTQVVDAVTRLNSSKFSSKTAQLSFRGTFCINYSRSSDHNCTD